MSHHSTPIVLVTILSFILAYHSSWVDSVSIEKEAEAEEVPFRHEEDKCAGDDGVGLVCKDPFGSFCFQSKCHCKDDYPIESDGICLKNVTSLGEGCWISDQCVASTPNSACLRSSGRVLHDIFEPLWEVYVKSDGINKYVPGKCGCDPSYKLQVVLNRGFYGTVGPAFNTCIPRSIGSSCKTNYECATRARFSRCQERKCTCPSPDYEHQYATDECIPALKATECLEQDENGSCKKTEKLALHYLWSSEMAGFIGFAASMGLMFLVWSLFCRVSDGIGSLTGDYAYTPGQVNYFPGLEPQDETDDTGDDEPPPAYDDVVMKPRSEDQAASSSASVSATFRNPAAVNNT